MPSRRDGVKSDLWRYPGTLAMFRCTVWLALCGGLASSIGAVGASEPRPEQDALWQPASPRDELKPKFGRGIGPRGYTSLTIEHDGREGLDGYWKQAFPVAGGTWYRFHCVRKAENVAVPRRSSLVRIVWTDDKGNKVRRDAPPGNGYAPQSAGNAEAEHPQDGPIDKAGWCEVAGVFQAPKAATNALVELHLQWAPYGKVSYSEVEFAETTAPPPRKVRLAAIHYLPKPSKTPAEVCEQFAPLIAEAAQQKADLVVLGETITYAGMRGSNYEDVAEPIPGPSTDYFAALAKQHKLHIVVGLYERAEHLIYNVAVLLGPDGKLIGKYRKVALPRDEFAAGVAPGSDYPVFDTQIGKIGLMVCYDGFFPEVARQLSNNGAEIIAWPVWGCNPLLAQARACENHVYVVSSTYGNSTANWMRTAVYDHEGKALVAAEDFGTVVTAEVDLAKPLNWNSLGDFKAELPRHRPVWSKHGDE